MKTYIAILRGINVSGQKLIKMIDLRKHMESLGYQEVQTYIQSGNIIFKTSQIDKNKISKSIGDKIKQTYSFEVPVITRDDSDIKWVLKNNPFINQDKEADRLYITFLSKAPAKSELDKIDGSSYLPEEFICKKDVIFFYSPKGYGKAKMNNNFFESKLKVSATTRNWKTVNKLFEIASGLK